MTLASAAGLLFDGLYTDPQSTSSMLRAYDLVTLVLAVPCLGAALALSRRGSIHGELFVAAMLAFAIYNYAFYALGTRFNPLFLLHIVVVTSASWALLLRLSTIDVGKVAELLGAGRSRWAAIPLALLSAGLAGMWVFASLRFAVTGDIPVGSSLVETDSTVHLGIALDLWLLVPTYALAAALIWRRQPWGMVLGAMVLISGLLHQVSYVTALPFQVQAEVPRATSVDLAEPFIVLLYVAGCAALFWPRTR